VEVVIDEIIYGRNNPSSEASAQCAIVAWINIFVRVARCAIRHRLSIIYLSLSRAISGLVGCFVADAKTVTLR
jgi:hypothetical protein